MFEMFAKVEIEILTLEVDVRFEDASDLYVEVYVVDGGFSSIVNDESAWKLVAETTMVLAPEGVGAIIPVQDFKPVLMPRRTKRSFYITMRDRAIDFTAYALQKTGEIAVDNEDFNILVGSGLAEYKFPEKIDRILDPQFSGVVHYKAVPESCDTESLVSTSVEYKFLFGIDADQAFIQNVNSIVDTIVEKQLGQNAALIQYGKEHKLSVGEDAQSQSISFSGNCPPEWSVCPKTYEVTTVVFTHTRTLPGGLVKLEFLNSYEFAAGAMQSSLPSSIPSIYLGEKSVSFQYTLTLDGVPSDVEMDAIQRDYFSTVATSFVDSSANDRFSTVLDFAIDTQQTNSERRRIQNRATNSVGGVIHGSLPAAFESSHFKETLELAFGESNTLIEMLIINGLRPSQVTADNRISYFEEIDQISANFEEIVRKVDPVDTQDDSLSNSAIAMIEGAAFIVFLVGITWSIHSYRKAQRRKREAKENRKRRRDNLRNEREDKKMNDEATVSLISASERPAKALGPSLPKKVEQNAQSVSSASGMKSNSSALESKEKPPLLRNQSSAGLSSNHHSKSTSDKTRPVLVKSHSVAGLGGVPSKENSVQTKAIGSQHQPNETALSKAIKRPSVTRSQSASVVGTSIPSKAVAVVGSVKKVPPTRPNPEIPPPKPPATEQKSRPTFARSLSASALVTKSAATSGKTAVSPTILQSKSDTKTKAVTPVTANSGLAKVRPTVARSLSVSVLSSGSETKQKVMTNLAKVPVRSDNTTVAQLKPRPLLKKSHSVSALGIPVPAKPVPSSAQNASNEVVKTGKSIPNPIKPAPTLVRRQSSSILVQDQPLLSLKQTNVSAAPNQMVAVVEKKPRDLGHNASPARSAIAARPLLARSQSTSVLQSGGKTTSPEVLVSSQTSGKQLLPKTQPRQGGGITTPGPPRTNNVTAPTSRPLMLRSQSFSVLNSSRADSRTPTEKSTNAETGASVLSQLSKNQDHCGDHTPKGLAPPRPSFTRSQSSSILMVKAAATTTKTGQGPQVGDGLSMKVSNPNQPCFNSGPTQPGPGSKDSVEVKLKVTRPQFLRSQSSSIVQPRSPNVLKISPSNGTIMKGEAKTPEVGGEQKERKQNRPAFQRSQSISILQPSQRIAATKMEAISVEIDSGGDPASDGCGSVAVEVTETDEKTVQQTKSQSRPRPAFARSMSVSVIQQNSVKHTVQPQSQPNIQAGDQKVTATPKPRPQFARSTSSSVLKPITGSFPKEQSQASTVAPQAPAKPANRAVVPGMRPSLARSMSSSVLQQKATSNTEQNSNPPTTAQVPNVSIEPTKKTITPAKFAAAPRPALARSLSSTVLVSNQNTKPTLKVAVPHGRPQPTKQIVRASTKVVSATRPTFSRSMSSSVLQKDASLASNVLTSSASNADVAHAPQSTIPITKPVPSTTIPVRPRPIMQRSMSTSLLKVNPG